MAISRRSSVTISLVAAAGILAGCAGGSDPSGGGDDAAPQISFLYSPYADYAPFFLAEDKGYFEEAGVDVELLAKGGTSGETYQLVSTNNVTAGGAPWGAGRFNATAAGASLSVIASVSRVPESGPNPAPFGVAAASGMTAIEQVAGRRGGRPARGRARAACPRAATSRSTRSTPRTRTRSGSRPDGSARCCSACSR